MLHNRTVVYEAHNLTKNTTITMNARYRGNIVIYGMKQNTKLLTKAWYFFSYWVNKDKVP